MLVLVRDGGAVAVAVAGAVGVAVGAGGAGLRILTYHRPEGVPV